MSSLSIPSIPSFAMGRFASVKTLLSSRKLRIIPMIADGNCFYRAISSAVYKDAEMHHLLRRMTMEHMLEDLNEYEPFFDSAVSLRRKIISNKRTRVWNSDLADIVPLAVARLLACRIHIYSVAEDEEVTHYTFGESGNTIRLLHHDNHYELLLK